MANDATKWTPEPWDTMGGALVSGKGKGFIASFDNADDMRRAQQCVNACKGINPEAVPIAVSLLRTAVQEYDTHGPNVVNGPWLDRVREVIALAEKQ